MNQGPLNRLKGEWMSEIKDGGSAFPGMEENACGQETGWKQGMTLRQWFAGMALQGLLANPSPMLKNLDIPELAYEYADAMLRAGKGEK